MVLTAVQFGDPLTSASNARLAGIVTGAFLLAIAVSLAILTYTRVKPDNAEEQPLLATV